MKKSILRIKAAVSAVIIAVSVYSGMLQPAFCSYYAAGFDKTYADENYENIPGTVIYAEDGVSEEVKYSLSAYYTMIPETVRQLMQQYGSRIYLSSSCAILSTDSNPVSCAALTSGGSVNYEKSTRKIIEIAEAPYTVYDADYEEYTYTIVHEAGHIFDALATIANGYCGSSMYMISSTDEWKQIYERDKAALMAIDDIAALNFYDEREAWAECFRLAYSNPDGLYAASPDAYEYVLRAVAEYS